MPKIKCDLWCKNEENGFCNKDEVHINDLQHGEKLNPKCYEFEVSKAVCYACEHCVFNGGDDTDTCSISGHIVTNESTCTNGEFIIAD